MRKETETRTAEGVLKTGPLHTLWGKAKDHPDYVKAEWRELAEMVEGGQFLRERQEVAPDLLEALLAALETARDALAVSYDVTEYPADGNSRQDEAIKVVDAAIWKARS